MEEYLIIKERIRKSFEVGMSVIGHGDNEFKITEIRENDDPFMWDAITLRNRSGEIEIASNDLQFFTIINK